jgi:hypothetical protein
MIPEFSDEESMGDYDIQAILKNNQLEAFIAGDDEFFAARPEEDYARWARLAGYYRSLNDGDKTKEQIKAAVLALFDRPERVAKIASLTLSRNLDFVEIKDKAAEAIAQGEFSKLDRQVQYDILLVSAQFKAAEMGEFTVATAIQSGILKDYLLWSSDPANTTRVTDDDLWRVLTLAHYYENAGSSIRRAIEKQLNELPQRNQKINTIFNAFLNRGKDFPSFRDVVRKLV